MRRTPLLLLTLPLVLLLACGDDVGPADTGTALDATTQDDAGSAADATTPADSGTPADAGNPSDSGQPSDAGTPADASAPSDSGTPADAGEIPDAGTSTSACTNEADTAIINSQGEAALTTATRDCIIGCIADPNRVDCTAQCMTTETNISLACTTCFAERADCALSNCSTSGCITDPAGQDCTDCQIANNCVSNFETCSGL